MKGRKPMPLKIHRLNGNPSKLKLDNIQCPESEARIPRCPEQLDDMAKKEWKRITRELHKIQLIGRIDMAAIAAYCCAYSRWIKCEEITKKGGMLVKDDKGRWHISPVLRIAEKALDQMKAFLVEFGMTPSSRARIKVELKEQDSLTEQFLFGKKVQ